MQRQIFTVIVKTTVVIYIDKPIPSFVNVNVYKQEWITNVSPVFEDNQHLHKEGESWSHKTNPRGARNSSTVEINLKTCGARTNHHEKRITWHQEKILRN